MKKCHTFAFVGGAITVNGEGHPETGSGQLAFDDDDLQFEPYEDRDGVSRFIDLPRSELIGIRDFLNRLLPVEPATAEQ
jgi:hypothetical protein